MITLNEIAYNIQNIMYPNTLTIEGEIPLRQIKHWIHYHRAKLIQDNISKGILNFGSIYQRINHTIPRLPSTDNFYRDLYGRETSRMKNRGDWRNLGKIFYNIPEIIMLPNNSAIKEVSVSRIIYDQNNVEFADEMSSRIHLSQRSKTEKEFSSFNKFTNNNKPFYTIDREADLDDGEDNGGPQLQVWGLKRSPNYFGDLQTSVAENLQFRYLLGYTSILQDPTNLNEIHIDEDQIFDEDKTPYPIPLQYIPDLIQRIVQSEIATSLKIMENES